MKTDATLFIATAAVIACGMFIHHDYISTVVLDVEGCVTSCWQEYEDRTQQMPSVELESVWRDACWTELKAATK
jgi:hypothetical protein